MDVRELAPALLAMGDLLRDANAALYPHSPEVTLEIRANERGSFVVHLIVHQPDTRDQIVTILTSPEATAAATLATLLGIVVGVGKGVLWLIQKIGGRRVSDTQTVAPSVVRLILDDETTIEVPA